MSDSIYRIFHTIDAIIIHNIMKPQIIAISKENLAISIEDKSCLDFLNIIKSDNSNGIIGIIQIGIFDILIFIKNSKKVGNIGNKEIYEIVDIDFIQLSKNSDNENLKTMSEIVTILEEINTIFREGFYYSHDFDLTNSLQTQKNLKILNNNYYDKIKNSNKDFLWNFELYTKFSDCGVDSDFLINLINGFVEIKREVINDNLYFDYILISRRSTKNAGVKSIKLGVDKSGNAANYLETEQILICGKNVFSYVQIRANPPIFYNKFYSSLLAGKNTANNENILLYEIIDKHFQKILKNTSLKYIFVINLMNQFIKEEKTLTEIYENLIMERNYKNLRYTYFDYDWETKNMNRNFLPNNNLQNGQEDPVDKFINKIEDILSSFNFFGIYFPDTDSHTNQTIQNSTMIEQQGIIRTSCYDSLERTNSIQMRIAWNVLLKQFELMNINSHKTFGTNFNFQFEQDEEDNKENFVNIVEKKNNNKTQSEYEQLISFTNGTDMNCSHVQNKNSNIKYPENFSIEHDDSQINLNNFQNIKINNNSFTGKVKNFSPPHKFLKRFKKIWIDNEVKIARQYLGVSHGDNLINSENEYHLNKKGRNYSNADTLKQRCIDILLKKYHVSFHNVNDEKLKRELENHIDKYTKTEDITLFIGSWNVAGQSGSGTANFSNWLHPNGNYPKNKTPDMYVIGLQEIVELNANYLLISSNNHRVEYWKNSIYETLATIDKYTMIKCLDLVGVFLIIFVKSSLKEKIKNFDHVIIKTGLMGTMGNKGSCLIRLNYLDTTLAFSCGHLAAGSSANANRLNEMHEIMEKKFPLHKDIKFKEHDVAIIFGDLNFRIDVDYNTCIEMIKNKCLSTLSENDQFNKFKNSNSNLSELQEGPLEFNPTYKYIKGTNEYDSKSKRVPSWCDRIFYKKNRFINQHAYNRAELLNSDHRPIFSIFTICTYKEIVEEKAKLIKEIKQNLLLEMKPNIDGSFQKIKKKFNIDEFMRNEKTDLRGGESSNWFVDNSDSRENSNNDNGDILNYFK